MSPINWAVVGEYLSTILLFLGVTAVEGAIQTYEGPYVVYGLFDAEDNCIYIGRTTDPIAREKIERVVKKWIQM